jgi:hypothetical protein
MAAATKSAPLTEQQVAIATSLIEAYGLTGKKYVGGNDPSLKGKGMTPERTISYLATSPSIRSIYSMGHGKGQNDIVKVDVKASPPDLKSCTKVLVARGWTADQALSAWIVAAHRGADVKAPMLRALDALGKGKAPKAKPAKKVAPKVEAPAEVQEVATA